MSQQIPPLWDFALRLYRQNGVSDDCIRWQDEYGVNVCVLLALCWSDYHTLGAQPKPLLKAARNWISDVVEPLRAIRRKIKQGDYFDDLDGGADTLETFRIELKTLEIHSEKLLLKLLEQQILEEYDNTPETGDRQKTTANAPHKTPKKQNAALTYLQQCGVCSAGTQRLWSAMLNIMN